MIRFISILLYPCLSALLFCLPTMLRFFYCGYAKFICRVLALLHSASFTLLQVKRHTVSAIDHPGSPTDDTHIMYLHREYYHTISTQYTLFRYMVFPAIHFSGRDAVTEQKPYSPVPLHYMPHISTLQVVYDVIFLVIMSSALCMSSGMAAMAGSISGASCAWYRVLTPQAAWAPCIIHRTSFYMFWGQPCRGIWYAQPWFVPHITPVRTICPAAPGEFLLLCLPPLVVCFLWHFQRWRLFYLILS